VGLIHITSIIFRGRHMDTKLVETQVASCETQVTDSALRTDTVNFFEMGDVSVETKGTLHGLEWSYTPHY
jgi:hypothetical protein